MDPVELEKIHAIMEAQIQIFEEKIKDICSVDNRALHTDRSDFPIFQPASVPFFEFRYYENLLEQNIRDNLVTPALVELFKASGIEVIENEKPAANWGGSLYNNEMFGKDYPVAFRLKTGSANIGVRYSHVCFDDPEAEEFLRSHKLDRVEIIDWSNEKEADAIDYGVSEELRSKFCGVTLKNFFTLHFSVEVYECFVKKIKDAVEVANREIGFHTIPNLSLRYLSEFKQNVLTDLPSLPYDKMRYQEFKEGTLTGKSYELLPKEDYAKIRERFENQSLFNVFLGKSDFAKCFLTSEYMYQVFRKGVEHCFDYTAVVTGYFKSVELLLEKIMELALETKGHENLWIACRYTEEQKKDEKFSVDFRKKKKTWQVRFKENYKKFFKTEMGSLSHFVHDRADGWSISKEGVENVFQCLMNYSSDCRNDHLHKDVIEDIESVEGIRHNTILCLYYLLGSCKFSDTPDSDARYLGAETNDFNRLYEALLKIPRSVTCFRIMNGKEEIRALRLYDQDRTEYDSWGNIISTVNFTRVADFNHKDDTPTPENLIKLSRENVPQKIYWQNDQKEAEVVW